MASKESPGRRQQPTTEQETDAEGTATAAADGPAHEGPDGDVTVEDLLDEKIRSQIAELEDELEALERQVEEIENFARISLNERKLKQAETNLTEFSDSLTAFAEKAFNNINELESRLDEQALVLATVLDALEREGIDVDTESVERQRAESVVATETPEEELSEAIEQF